MELKPKWMVFLCTLFHNWKQQLRGLSIEEKIDQRWSLLTPNLTRSKHTVSIFVSVCALALEGEGRYDSQGDPIVTGEKLNSFVFRQGSGYIYYRVCISARGGGPICQAIQQLPTVGAYIKSAFSGKLDF